MKKRLLSFLLANLATAGLCTAQHYTSMSAGLVHASALRSDGSLWAWGNNAYGQLGDGTTTEAHSPVNVGTGHYWIAVAAGGIHQLALDSAHHLWGCGNNIDPNAIPTATLAAEDVTLFPNPTTSNLNIILPASNAAGATLQVYNSQGKMILTQQGAATNILNVQSLPAGIYMLQVQSAGGLITKRFSKQ